MTRRVRQRRKKAAAMPLACAGKTGPWWEHSTLQGGSLPGARPQPLWTVNFFPRRGQGRGWVLGPRAQSPSSETYSRADLEKGYEKVVQFRRVNSGLLRVRLQPGSQEYSAPPPPCPLEG